MQVTFILQRKRIYRKFAKSKMIVQNHEMSVGRKMNGFLEMSFVTPAGHSRNKINSINFIT